MPAEVARGQIYTLDSRGLVTSDRSLEPYKQKFAKDPSQISWLKDSSDNTLENVIKNEKITVLIGTSGQYGCFTEQVVKAVHKNTDRPMILPLSNPTANCEALPEDIYAWTDGKALVATGSPFSPVNHGGSTFHIGQCNNVFVFPGVGLGIIASGAKEVLPSFFTAAARAVSDYVTDEAMEKGELVPPVTELQNVSLKVARSVGETALEANVGRLCAFSDFQHNNDPDRLRELIDNMRWQPEYLPLIRESQD
jgi:malate dehydrogenase (oxaloacetate-decarboxylating)